MNAIQSMMKIKDWVGQARHALTASEVVTRLAKLQGWILRGDGENIAIEKNFSFLNYFQTMAFVNAVAMIAHRQNHHPELVVNFNHCSVRFNTHDVKGLSLTDFECAALVDALLDEVHV